MSIKEDVFIAAVVLSAGVLGAGVGALLANDSNPFFNECAQEDSSNCFWDAQERGNGEGYSYVVDDDNVVYYRIPTDEMPDWDKWGASW